jgi:hypothetical protein
MDTRTEAAAVEADDIAIIIPANGDDDFDPIPAGAYTGKLTNFRVVDKPEWKVEGDRVRNPEREVDLKQWEWTFLLTEGEYAGEVLTDYTSRSWHERANAHKHAAALLDKPRLDPVEGLSTKQLIGKACQIWVTVNTSQKTGKARNYVDKILPVPKPRLRSQRASAPVVEGGLGLDEEDF